MLYCGVNLLSDMYWRTLMTSDLTCFAKGSDCDWNVIYLRVSCSCRLQLVSEHLSCSSSLYVLAPYYSISSLIQSQSWAKSSPKNLSPLLPQIAIHWYHLHGSISFFGLFLKKKLTGSSGFTHQQNIFHP